VPNDTMLSVVLLNVMMSVILLNVITLNVLMLNVCGWVRVCVWVCVGGCGWVRGCVSVTFTGPESRSKLIKWVFFLQFSLKTI
jgi:hypothetical protein